MQTIGILTLNTYGIPILDRERPNRQRYIADRLNWLDVDILNLQEVMTYDTLYMFKRKLRAFPYACFEPGLIGPKGGLITFSKCPLRKIEFSEYSREFMLSKSMLARLNPKGILGMQVVDQPLIIINTHLAANKDNDWSKENRYYRMHEAQLKQLSEYIKEVVGTDKFGLITGDFNISKASQLYRNFIDQPGLNDVFAANDTPTFHSEFLSEGRQSNRIDYILVFCSSGECKVLSTEEMFREKEIMRGEKEMYVSDHIGLCARIELG